MKKQLLIAVGLVLAGWASSAVAADDFDLIRLIPPPPAKAIAPIQGIIQESATPFTVAIKVGNNVREVRFNEMQWIDYHGSPAALKSANLHAYKKEYKELSDALRRVNRDQLPVPDMVVDCDYYKALLSAHSALSGSGKPADAIALLTAWTQANPKNYHYLDACELLGDLNVAIDKIDDARRYYGILAASPFAEHKLRAGVSMGRAFLAQNNPAVASRAFDVALNSGAEGEVADVQLMAAKIGKAECVAEEGKPDDAIKTLSELLADVQPDETELSARVYNALGRAYLKKNDTQEAFFAYLHVELLYPNAGDARAEALYHLVGLWNGRNKGDRAQEVMKELNGQYKSSRWTRLAAAKPAAK